MEKKNYLRWNPMKFYMENGEKRKIVVNVSLDDDCKNMHSDFSITCNIYTVKKNGRMEEYAGGCCHDEICKHFPELKKFIHLHLCDHSGIPMYPVENGIYHIEHSLPTVAMEYLRITESEFISLSKYAEERELFKFLLFDMGIVARWKKEADEFIAFLEEKCNCEWSNPYSPNDERFRLTITDDEINSIRKKIRDGEFSESSIEERRRQELEAELYSERAKLENDYEQSVNKAKIERDVLLSVLDSGLPIKNVIFYNHTKQLHFNWKEYEKMISMEDFEKFKKENSGKLNGVTFHIDHFNKK